MGEMSREEAKGGPGGVCDFGKEYTKETSCLAYDSRFLIIL
jgi:hypothetical protein